MTIIFKNLRLIKKTEGGHILETPLTSQHSAELSGNIVKMLRAKQLYAEPKISEKRIVIPSLYYMNPETGKPNRIDRGRQSILAGKLSKALERDYNIRMNVEVH